MPKFIKITPITASQWWRDGDHPEVTRLPDHVALDSNHQVYPRDEHGWIGTLENGHVVTPGDWISGPGPKGEFYPIKPEVMATTYKQIED